MNISDQPVQNGNGQQKTYGEAVEELSKFIFHSNIPYVFFLCTYLIHFHFYTFSELILKYLFITITVSQAYTGIRTTDLKSMKQEIFYVADRIALSISLGNTNQTGRDCWNAFIQLINNNVRRFVNELYEEYHNGNFQYIYTFYAHSPSI